jgi:hypothetical protein
MDANLRTTVPRFASVLWTLTWGLVRLLRPKLFSASFAAATSAATWFPESTFQTHHPHRLEVNPANLLRLVARPPFLLQCHDHLRDAAGLAFAQADLLPRPALLLPNGIAVGLARDIQNPFFVMHHAHDFHNSTPLHPDRPDSFLARTRVTINGEDGANRADSLLPMSRPGVLSVVRFRSRASIPRSQNNCHFERSEALAERSRRTPLPPAAGRLREPLPPRT